MTGEALLRTSIVCFVIAMIALALLLAQWLR